MTKQQVRELANKAIVAETTVPCGDGEPSPEKEGLIDTAMTEQQVRELAPKATVVETTVSKGDNQPSRELEGVIDASLTEQLETVVAPEPIPSSTGCSTEADYFQVRGTTKEMCVTQISENLSRLLGVNTSSLIAEQKGDQTQEFP
ncbi:hypothetical protein MTO96_016259 [Rhipicephalus appendiculatus]